MYILSADMPGQGLADKLSKLIGIQTLIGMISKGLQDCP